MNRIETVFKNKNKEIISIYCTAGFPKLNSTMDILRALQKNGADMVELGIPFSDPLADGPVIQHSSEIALRNGMNLDLLFEQTREMRREINIPVVLMGYLNPILQYGFERFLSKAKENGFDAVILPDLPLREYELFYKSLFEQYGIGNIFLVTPQTAEERIKRLDQFSDGFIYMVSSASTTGAKDTFSMEQEQYFERMASYDLKNPLIAGFGISNRKTLEQACKYARGAIIGSAFIKALGREDDVQGCVKEFMESITNKKVVG